ncbi:UDP-N-acetylglucosamine 2-epimerase (non-hydrolyzing) [Salinimicrobium sp. TIG7-5_MAKvit]|uniref:non-hydrolyzing UDP-N-acetylglucosamine 2-epimerase n=1 Tax=Salinimicrobium sp. TIG7-5_MAKvit TaxID=3121289 RepID=UPI003C6E077D
MKLLLVFGTRPEAIKMAPVIFELKKRNLSFAVCVTGQHKEMLYEVLEFFNIDPDYSLDVMSAEQSLNTLSSRILLAIDEVLQKEDSNVVMVHGDTATSSMTALAAYQRGVRVVHVEAGLRTYNKKAPFPEEINRQITARIADLHFAPTEKAKLNLLQEGIPESTIFVTGNTVVDALKYGITKSKNYHSGEIEKLSRLLDQDKKLILVTGHRRENFGLGLSNLCDVLKELGKSHDLEIIFPVHLNPTVQDAVYSRLENEKNIHLTGPVQYSTMLWLMGRCVLVISDSGGIQEEMPYFRKPVIITRDVTERMEGVEAGFAFLAGTSKEQILNKCRSLLANPPEFKSMHNPYGDGLAAERIVAILEQIREE